jgi:tRNA (cytidine/uridine-2'-O-)-methyltransferase
MDYIELASVTRHPSWQRFRDCRRERLVLLTTQAAVPFTDFAFDAADILLLGRESAGVPPDIHQEADARIVIPMASSARSLNVALAAAMVLGEALRQTGSFSALHGEEATNDGY